MSIEAKDSSNNFDKRDISSWNEKRLFDILNTSQFNRHMEQAGIATTEGLVRWTTMLLPYGQKIWNNLQSKLYSMLEWLGYEEISIPSLVSAQYMKHLKQEWLFRFSHPDNDIFLSPWAETLLALWGLKTMKRTHQKDVKLFTSWYAYRQEIELNKYIKNMEFQRMELSTLLSSQDEVIEEEIKLNTAFQHLLDELQLSYFQVNDRCDMQGQTKLISYFPFSKKFGTAFGTYKAKDTYLRNVPWYQETGLLQLCWLSTDRLLSLYLANHMDHHWFQLGREVAPYDIHINRSEFSQDEFDHVSSVLYQENIKPYISKEASYYQNFRNFNLQWFPMLIGKGQWEVKMIDRRDGRVVRLPTDTWRENVKKTLVNYRPLSAPPFQVQHIQDMQCDHYEDGTMYCFEQLYEQEIKSKHPRLKKIWYISEPYAWVVFVTNKY